MQGERVMKSSMLLWTGHEAQMKVIRNEHGIYLLVSGEPLLER
jgi:hypothetical protein